MVEIVGGTPKADARSIHDAADAEAWDRLAADIARLRAQGRIVARDGGDD